MSKILTEAIPSTIEETKPETKPETIKTEKRPPYTYDETLAASLEYFNGDELPAKVFVDKYAVRDHNNNFYELTPDDMHRRMSKEFGRIELKFRDASNLNGNFKSLSTYGQKREFLSVSKIYDLFKGFNHVVPQGSVMSLLGNSRQIGSLSNCIVLPELFDSYGGIMYADQQLVQLQKRRCGTGLDLSSLRPEGTAVTNAAGTSTGIASFMERFSNTTREVAQNGRRGATMLTCDIAHPDVEKFVTIKQDLSKVTGANISVRLSDEFMRAVKEDKEYTHRWPIDSANPTVTKTIKARDLWATIIKCAHNTAEPGLIFWDRQHKYSTSSIYPGYKNVSTNPCLTKDTWIMTNNGPKQIVDLIGVPFIGLINNTTQKSTEEGFFFTGNREVFELKTKKGFIIKATAEHPFKKSSGEMVELKDLKIGDKLSLNNNRNVDWSGNGNREIGWLVGNLLGDGTFSGDRAYLEYWGDNKFDMKGKAIMMIKNNLKYRKGFLGEGTVETAEAIKRDRTRFGSSELKKIANELGLKNDKTIDSTLEKTSSDFYKGFISGWFDADGCVGNKIAQGIHIRLASSIVENLKIAQRMLARLGIISTIYENRKPEGWYDMPDGKGGLRSVFCNAGNELVIAKDNLYLFQEIIGFQDEKKSLKLDNALRERRNTQKPVYIEKFTDKIISINSVGSHDTYCCTVFPDHLIDVNGIITGQCSEIAMQGGDSCRLIAINLFGSVKNPFTKEASFDHDEFYKIVYESQRMMDDLVELELEAIDRILSKIEADPEPSGIKHVELETWKVLRDAGQRGRRTGLGFTGLADTIAALGHKNDSNEALDVVDKIMRTKLRGEFDSSIDMALERGKFDGFSSKIEQTSEFVQMMCKEFNDVYARMMQHGRRNISISTVAPTGSLSMLTQTSSGIEPVFMTSYTRRKKITHNDKASNVKVDFTDAMGDKWQEFPVYHPKLKMWMEVTGETDEKKSPYAGSTASEIDWAKRINLQSVVQKYTTHSISSTINLPKDVSVEKVGEIYLQSWEMGLKGITVYRDGSRSGVLISTEEKNAVHIKENHAPKRPRTLECDIVRFYNKGDLWIGFIGLYEGRPYEIFTGKAGELDVPSYVETGTIMKTRTPDKGNRYDFMYEDKEGKKCKEEWLNKCFDKHYHSYAKLISGILRHGMPMPYVVELISSLKLDDDLITTWKWGVVRMFKKYIPDGTHAPDKKCKDCGAEDSVIYQEGCLVCSSCGSSKCGG